MLHRKGENRVHDFIHMLSWLLMDCISQTLFRAEVSNFVLETNPLDSMKGLNTLVFHQRLQHLVGCPNCPSLLGTKGFAGMRDFQCQHWDSSGKTGAVGHPNSELPSRNLVNLIRRSLRVVTNSPLQGQFTKNVLGWLGISAGAKE